MSLIYKHDRDIVYYHDLTNIPGYGHYNLFDVGFTQNKQDYIEHNDKYLNIENGSDRLFDPYELETLNDELRFLSENIINKYFKINEEITDLFNERLSNLDFTKTIGVHRRATDITIHNSIVPLESIFNEIDSSDFEYVFLMCDNKYDYEKFKEKYGDKLICYDTYSSEINSSPFFKNNNNENDIKKHIIELVFGVTTLSKVKKLICGKSNLSSFVILSNSKLKYKILQ
jgi:hypothetical protein